MPLVGAVVGIEALGNWYGGLGNTWMQMIAGLITMVAAVIFNWLLIGGHLGAPRWASPARRGRARSRAGSASGSSRRVLARPGGAPRARAGELSLARAPPRRPVRPAERLQLVPRVRRVPAVRQRRDREPRRRDRRRAQRRCSRSTRSRSCPRSGSPRRARSSPVRRSGAAIATRCGRSVKLTLALHARRGWARSAPSTSSPRLGCCRCSTEAGRSGRPRRDRHADAR